MQQSVRLNAHKLCNSRRPGTLTTLFSITYKQHMGTFTSELESQTDILAMLKLTEKHYDSLIAQKSEVCL
jgi:hypothetical protein